MYLCSVLYFLPFLFFLKYTHIMWVWLFTLFVFVTNDKEKPDNSTWMDGFISGVQRGYEGVAVRYSSVSPPFTRGQPCSGVCLREDRCRTQQVSESYAWRIAISHDGGVKGNGVR